LWCIHAVVDVGGPLRNENGRWTIVEAPELEQGVEAQIRKTSAKSLKSVGEEGGKTRVKKSAQESTRESAKAA
jgi:hypothetical protein